MMSIWKNLCVTGFSVLMSHSVYANNTSNTIELQGGMFTQGEFRLNVDTLPEDVRHTLTCHIKKVGIDKNIPKISIHLYRNHPEIFIFASGVAVKVHKPFAIFPTGTTIRFYNVTEDSKYIVFYDESKDRLNSKLKLYDCTAKKVLI